MFLLQPVLEVMHFVRTAFYYLLAFSYHIGRGIFLVFGKAWAIVGDIFTALGIIGEEFYHFLCELNASLDAIAHYVGSSTNMGIDCVLKSCVIFGNNMKRFFRSTQLYSRLLATKAGQSVCEFFALLKGALLLIADCIFWLPRTLLAALLAVADACVFGISFVRQLILQTVHILLDDIFRLIVGLLVLFVLVHKRRRIFLAIVRFVNKVKVFLGLICSKLSLNWVRIQNRLRNRNVTATAIRRAHSARPRDSLSPNSGEKVPDSQRCVVCRDRAKSVLLLPCKHLCLCEECADYIEFTSHSPSKLCPLCRSEIVHTISVFT